MTPLRFVSLHRIVSILLATCLLSSSAPAAPQTIIALVEEQRTGWSFWYYSSGLSNLFQGRGLPSPRPQERQADRNAKLERLEISPTNVTVELAERVRFVAVGYDANGNTVGGVKVKWRVEASTAGQRARISPDGEFYPLVPGVFTVTAESAGEVGPNHGDCAARLTPGSKRSTDGLAANVLARFADRANRFE